MGGGDHANSVLFSGIVDCRYGNGDFNRDYRDSGFPDHSDQAIDYK